MDNLLPNSQRKQNILPGPLRQSCYGLVVNKIKLYLWRWAAHAMHGLLLQDKGIPSSITACPPEPGTIQSGIRPLCTSITAAALWAVLAELF